MGGSRCKRGGTWAITATRPSPLHFKLSKMGLMPSILPSVATGACSSAAALHCQRCTSCDRRCLLRLHLRVRLSDDGKGYDAAGLGKSLQDVLATGAS